MTTDPAALAATATELARSAARGAWRGPDAYDGLWHGWPRPLVGGRRRRQVFMQLHARSPWDFRRLYRRRHPLIPKALGIYGSVGTRVHRLTGDPEPRTLALDALGLLMDDRTAGPAAWGYHWDMQTRWSYYPAGSPNVVVTAFASCALAEAAAAFERPELAERALGAARWIRDELFLEPGGYYVYHPGSRVNIHNANLLGAWIVHRLLPPGERPDEAIARAVEQTLVAQRADGSWGYGVGPSLEWADSFHSGYVLTCLARLADIDPRIPEALDRGLSFYRRFFDVEGRAMLWSTKRYPEDAHSAGTAMTTLATLLSGGLGDSELLERVAARTLACGIADGHAVYRRYARVTTTVKYIRWADAHVALGLADAAVVLSGGAVTGPPAPAGALLSSRP